MLFALVKEKFEQQVKMISIGKFCYPKRIFFIVIPMHTAKLE